jgi:hypothetical protein
VYCFRVSHPARRRLILVVRLKENSMRSLLFRTFVVAFLLSGLAIVANTLFFTRTLTPTEETEFGTTRGFSGSENSNVIEGAKVLWLFARDPSFAKMSYGLNSQCHLYSFGLPH